METGLAFLIFFPFASGLLAYLAGRADGKKEANARGQESGGTLRDLLVASFVVLEFIVMTIVSFSAMGNGAKPILSLDIPGVCGLGLHFALDGFRCIYGCVAVFMWMMAAILSREYFVHHHHRGRFYLFLLWTLGATMGVFLSADLYTTFVFFEIMSFTSYVWVAQEENGPALRAAATYLAVAVTGGLVMLMGIFLLYDQLGTLTIQELPSAVAACQQKDALNAAAVRQQKNTLYAAGACLLFGFGAKAGAFPLHIWLPKAHPVAPAPASAVLSGIITKSGILAVIRVIFYTIGADVIRGTWVQYTWMTLALLTVFMGSMMAYKEQLLKKRLAYSTVSQVSYIMFGLSVLNESGMMGALSHFVFHSVVKNCLFLAAGAVIYKTGKKTVSELGGIGKEMPVTMWCFTLVSVTLVGIPPTSGFISKWYLAEGSLGSGIDFYSWFGPVVLLLSAMLTAGYLLPISIKAFFPGAEYDYGKLTKKEPNLLMTVPMILFTAAAVLFGMFPRGFMEYLQQLAAGVF